MIDSSVIDEAPELNFFKMWCVGTHRIIYKVNCEYKASILSLGCAGHCIIVGPGQDCVWIS